MVVIKLHDGDRLKIHQIHLQSFRYSNGAQRFKCLHYSDNISSHFISLSVRDKNT